ncbi:sporulation integral membrane protein YlbJ [Clostridium bovifaecis]|uniref:Sporulation integral membrane protein YlbJ n=1 Tax=Clostridium bovifaecis TaxID=2184719 RepID=A0A6I6ESL4_9CLOT|nr:sporulation integral membrane protein YlbJ [Clostridium bovifaecis]
MIIIFSLLLILSLIVFLTFSLIKSKNIGFSKNLLVTFICTVFILNIVFNPKVSLSSALDGGKLFLSSVFVSIFPFLVLINIMLSYDGVNIYSKLLGSILCKPFKLPKNCSVVLIISILCGYPLGAKYASDLYEKKLIDFKTCERLISIASNPSPIFVLGAVGTSMLNSPSIGFLLLLSCYLSCIIMGFIIPPNNSLYSTYKNNQIQQSSVHNTSTLGDILKDSIDNAFKTSFSIGGFIVFFSVLTAIIKNNILFDIVFQKLSSILNFEKIAFQSFFLGLLEMTNGCNLVSSLNISNMYKTIIISFLLGFSGLSIISQTCSITYKINLPLERYIRRKFIQGIICSIIASILYSLDIFKTSMSTSTLESFKYSNFNLNSNIFIIQVVILITPIFLAKLLRLFNRTS